MYLVHTKHHNGQNKIVDCTDAQQHRNKSTTQLTNSTIQKPVKTVAGYYPFPMQIEAGTSPPLDFHVPKAKLGFVVHPNQPTPLRWLPLPERKPYHRAQPIE